MLMASLLQADHACHHASWLLQATARTVQKGKWSFGTLPSAWGLQLLKLRLRKMMRLLSPPGQDPLC